MVILIVRTLFLMKTTVRRSAGYVKNGEPRKAIDLFHEIRDADAHVQTDAMLTSVKKIPSAVSARDASNPRLLTSLLDALMMCSDVKSAESVFNTCKKKTLEMFGVMMKGILLTVAFLSSPIYDRSALFRVCEE